MLTTTQAIAKVIGTGILVVTRNGRSDTGPRLTVIANSAGIAVQTLPRVQLIVATARLTIAGIFGARIAVVAKRQKLPTQFVRFVHETVAVIILTITLFSHGQRCVTSAQPLFFAHPLAPTSSPFARSLARRPKTQLNGLSSAGTDPRIRHALSSVDAIDCDCR
jgi:hypothetical protein